MSKRITGISLILVFLASLLSGVVVSFAPKASAASYQDWPMFLQNPARSASTVDPKLSIARQPLSRSNGNT